MNHYRYVFFILILLTSVFFVSAQRTADFSPAGTNDLRGSEDTSIHILASFVPPTCNGGCDGYIKIDSVFGGAGGPYSYDWYPKNVPPCGDITGDGTKMISHCNGTYSVCVYDQTGNFNFHNIVMINPNPIGISPMIKKPGCTGDCDGNIALFITNASGKCTFEWTPSGIPPSDKISNLCAGIYSVIVTDEKNCSTVKNIILADPPVINLSTTVSDNPCHGDCLGKAFYSVSGGVKPYSFSWNHDPALHDSVSNHLCSGHYVFSMKDANGCHLSDTVEVKEPVVLSLTIQNKKYPTCFGYSDGSAHIMINGGTPPYSVTWSNGATDSIVNGLSEGIYTVTVYDAHSCLTTTSVSLTDPLPLSISVLENKPPSCYGYSDGKLSVSVSNGVSPFIYLWSQGSSDSIVNGLSEGDYYVTIYDSQSCAVLASITVQGPTPLTANVTEWRDPTCFGVGDGSAKASALGGTPPYGYVWSDGQTLDSAVSLKQGKYFISITDAHSCLTIDSVTITDPPLLSSSIKNSGNPSCFGLNDGFSSVSANGGTPPYSYHWSSGGTNPKEYGLSKGIYFVTVYDDHHCSSVSTDTIEEPQELIVSVSKDTLICIGQQVTISANAKGGNPGVYYYKWNNGQIGSTIVVNPETTTYYIVTVTSGKGCSKIGDMTVNVYPRLTVSLSASKDTACIGDTIYIDAKVSGGNGGPYSQSLLNGEPVTLPWAGLLLNTSTFSFISTDDCGTQSRDSITIIIDSVNQADIRSDFVAGCAPLKVNFEPYGCSFGYKYSWDFGEGTHQSTSENNIAYTYYYSGQYDVSLHIVSRFGCIKDLKKNSMINIFPSPVSGFTADRLNAGSHDPEIRFVNRSTNAITFTWNFGDSYFSSECNPSHRYEKAGRYTVELISKNQYQCTDKGQHEVIIREDYTFYVPTAFSPQVDGLNDLFSPVATGIEKEDYYFAVYDRWGDKVFETTVYDVDTSGDIRHGWNGRINNGKEVGITGLYTWIATFRDKQNILYQKTGNLLLIK